ncbi:glycosyltransferase family 2 protein [Isosphaeraceae bacterium EP7]
MTTRPPATVRLSVVIVNYNSWPDTLRLVGELANAPEVRSGLCEVVIVDNASAGPPPSELDAANASVRLVEREDNGGFAAGVNDGVRAAHGARILVLNPDVVTAPDFLSRVFRRLDGDEKSGARPPGVVGFALVNSDGSRQGSVGAFPDLARVVWEQFIPRSRRKYQADWRPEGGSVDWVTGACMLLSRDMLDEIGGMDEDFFLYHEEVALCRVARDAGWRVEYDPSAEVVHRDPLQNRALSPKMRLITRHSKLLYFRKHLPRWQFLILSWVVTLESGCALLWLRAREETQETRSWARIGEVARALRNGETPGGGTVRRLAEAVEETGPDDGGASKPTSGLGAHRRN